MAKRQTQYMILGGVAVAAVLFVSGFFAYPMINESEFNIANEQIGFGGYFTVEAYHSDGTLYQTWEGHNALNTKFKDIVVRCATDLPANSQRFGSFTCGGPWLTFVVVADTIDGVFGQNLPAVTIASDPPSCGNPRSSVRCVGWTTQVTFDFPTLSCTPGVDCPAINRIRTDINEILLDPIDAIPIAPGDRLIVTIDFSFA